METELAIQPGQGMGSGGKMVAETIGTHSRQNDRGQRERSTVVASVCTRYTLISDEWHERLTYFKANT